MRNNLFAKFIITLMLVSLLTFQVGRVQRVEAVATTTAVIVGEVLLGLGVTYMAYQTLTGANVYVPGYDETDMYEYVRGLGRDFSQSASGSKLFSDLYNKLVEDSTYSVMDFTQDRLRDIYNDHKDISILQSASSFVYEPVLDTVATTDFDYPFDFVSVPQVFYVGNTLYTFSDYEALGYDITPLGGARFIRYGDGLYSISYSNIDTPVRNAYNPSTGSYSAQTYVDGDWVSPTNIKFSYGIYNEFGVITNYLYPNSFNDRYTLSPNGNLSNIPSATYPVFADAPIYNLLTGDVTDPVPVSTELIKSPQYPQNDDNNNKFPIVPYVQLPSTQKWGFNWRDALTDLINGGSRLITYSWLADLINDFKNSLAGSSYDIDYNYFNEGDTYYVTYYSNTVNDIYNPIYNIDVSDQEDIVPIDLNTIQQFTENEYLDVVKERVSAFSDTVGSFVAFWHNIDYEIVYAVCGAAIAILIGAFIGKWGHS